MNFVQRISWRRGYLLLAASTAGLMLSCPAGAQELSAEASLPASDGAIEAHSQRSGVETPQSQETRTAARQVSFFVPLVYNQKVLGDIVIQVGGGAPTSFETISLRTQLLSLLNSQGIVALDAAIAGRAYIDASALSDAGIEARFDENQLEVVIDAISGKFRPVSSLGNEPHQSARDHLSTTAPADFSSYMNFNTNFDYSEDDSSRTPEVFMFGAMRYRNVVLELDGAVSDQFGDGTQFYRRSVRAIYDQPETYRRYSAGDLRLSTIPLLQTPFVGGVAVEKRRQIFNPIQPISRLGGQEIFLDNRSTVRVLINGTQYQTFELDAGRYDLSNLPIQVGTNNVELRVRDSSGREQSIDFDYFFEPLSLPAGEEEYVFTAGFIARDINFEPNYSDDPVAMGYYRKALSENLILGAAVEVSSDIQTLAAETTIVPQIFPGALDAQIATSIGEETGVAARASYRIRAGDSYANRKQFSVSFDYESSNYRTVGALFDADDEFFNVTSSYSQGLSDRTFLSAGATFTQRGGAQSDRSQAFVDITHRVNDRARLTAGVEVGEDGFSPDRFGIRLGLVVLFGGQKRGNIDYRSRTATTRANLSRGNENQVGSIGYDVGVVDTRDSTGLDAGIDYTGNRFDARASFFSDGGDFSTITDDQRVRLQVGTSIAYADGAFGVGRPISDSFAVVKAHKSLQDRQVISGRDLSGKSYFARSGLLGGAVQSDLSSFSSQNVQYDVDSLEPGYDIGDGIVFVDPPFRSGYKITVGNDRFVSTLGTLMFGESPASLVSGTIMSVDDEGFQPIPFFTNSIGRFGAIGLAPGKSYKVVMPVPEREFLIEVPSDNTGLYRLGTVKLPAEDR